MNYSFGDVGTTGSSFQKKSENFPLQNAHQLFFPVGSSPGSSSSLNPYQSTCHTALDLLFLSELLEGKDNLSLVFSLSCLPPRQAQELALKYLSSVLISNFIFNLTGMS